MENMEYNDNLTSCKYCGNMIAKEAKTCPHCGGKNKEFRRKAYFPLKVTLTVIIAFIGIFILASLIIDTIDYYLNYDEDTYDSYNYNENILSEEEYKETCYSVTYEELARNPGKYEGYRLKFTGEVFQKSYDSDGYAEYLIAVTKEDMGGEYYSYTHYKDNIYAYYYYGENDKLLEDDIVTIYGEGDGEYTYESVSGAEITVPAFKIFYVDFQ